MMASRGMGAMRASKMPKGVRKARRDDTDFIEYAEGGPVGLYANINARRRAGTSRPKSQSTIKPKVWRMMKAKKGTF